MAFASVLSTLNMSAMAAQQPTYTSSKAMAVDACFYYLAHDNGIGRRGYSRIETGNRVCLHHDA